MANIPNKPRLYYPAWAKLKQHRTIKIEANPALHKRIMKAINKELNMDEAYKFFLLERGEAFRLQSISSNNILTISLVPIKKLKLYQL